MSSKKVATIPMSCVACGNCVKSCPKGALSIYKGMYSAVNTDLCVGCGLCAKICPAGIIRIVERKAHNE